MAVIAICDILLVLMGMVLFLAGVGVGYDIRKFIEEENKDGSNND